MEPAKGFKPLATRLQVECAIVAPRRQINGSVRSFNRTHLRWSCTSLLLWCLAPQRSWTSECSIDGAGIVFTWLLILAYEPVEGQTGLGPATTCLEGKSSTN